MNKNSLLCPLQTELLGTSPKLNIMYPSKKKRRSDRLISACQFIILVVKMSEENDLDQGLLQGHYEEEDTEDVEHETLITIEVAINFIKKLQQYFQQRDDSTDIISILKKLNLFYKKIM